MTNRAVLWYSGIEHLAMTLWLGGYSEENIMALPYSGYFDASGKDDVMSVGGIVAPVRNLIRPEKAWSEVLEDYGISVFHMTDFASSKREFTAWKGDTKKRSSFISELASVIKENTNLLVAASVELDSWSTLNKQFALQEIWSHPYVLCGSNVVKQVRQWAKRKSITSMIEYVFEDGDEGKGELDKWCRDQIGVAPIFRSKLEAIPCQAADLIAWKNRITMLGIRKLKKSGDDEGMEQILKSLSTVAVRPTSGAIFSSAEIMRMCREIPIPERSSMMP